MFQQAPYCRSVKLIGLSLIRNDHDRKLHPPFELGGDSLGSLAAGLIPVEHQRHLIKGADEPRELANWAQQAIDTGDPILTDSVLRENFT